ncbi:hypothetical protein V6N13_033972 [Hibiscus sabdariffa]
MPLLLHHDSLASQSVKPNNGGVLEDNTSTEVVDFPAVKENSTGFFVDKRKLTAFRNGGRGYKGGASEGKGVGKISLGVEDSIRDEEWLIQRLRFS